MFKTFISYLWCPISGKPKVFTKKKKKKKIAINWWISIWHVHKYMYQFDTYISPMLMIKAASYSWSEALICRYFSTS